MKLKNIIKKAKNFEWSVLGYALWFGVETDNIPIISSITSVQSAYDNVMGIVNWVIGLAAFLAVIMVLYGGVTYISASGDADKIKQAQGTITNSLIALVVLFLLRTILAFILERMTNSFAP
jgi:hypothetical protein